jgi:hypothetical protein
MNYYRLSSDAIFAIKQPMTRTLELLLDIDEDTQVMPEYPMSGLMHTTFEISGEEIIPKRLVLANPPPVSCGLSVGFINHLSKLMNYCLLTQTNINDVMKQMRFYVDTTHTLELTDEYFDWFNSIVEKRHELGTLGMKEVLTKAAVEQVELISVTGMPDEKN